MPTVAARRAEARSRLEALPATRLGRVLLSTWFLGALIGLASWRTRSVLPEPGLDPSWPLGLRLAADQGLDFGRDVLFTYGPLGYLDQPLIAYSDLAAASVIYDFAVQLALGMVLLHAARQTFPLLVAFGVALVVACVIADPTSGDPVIAIGFLVCAMAVARGEEAPLWRALPVTIGIAAGLLLLVRLNTGVMLALSGLVAVAVPAPRRLARTGVFAASLALTLLVLWLLSGQSLGAIGDFLRGSAELMSGYSVTMAAHPAGYRLALGTLLIVAGIAAALLGGRGLAPSRRVALLLLALVLFLIASKGAFVRAEPLRSVYLITAAFAVVLAFRWQGRQRAAALLATVGIAGAFVVMSDQRTLDVFDLRQRVTHAVNEFRYAFHEDTRREQLAGAVRGIRRFYHLDPRTLSLLAGGDVHVYPTDTALVWAYGLDWDPLPVFQSYTAYTSYLDELNADELASAEGPERVLVYGNTYLGKFGVEAARADPTSLLETRNRESIDHRYLPWDQPAATLAMLCHFQPIRSTRFYLVLDRVPDRCAAPRRIATRTVPDGTPVEIPASPRPRDLVFARVYGLEPSGLERLRTLLYRAAFRYVSFDDEQSFRVAPGVLDDGLVLRVPRKGDLPKPFSVSAPGRELAFRTDSAFLSSGGDVRIEFFAMRYEHA